MTHVGMQVQGRACGDATSVYNFERGPVARCHAFLGTTNGVPIGITRQIAEGAKGNVRAAMADLEMWIG